MSKILTACFILLLLPSVSFADCIFSTEAMQFGVYQTIDSTPRLSTGKILRSACEGTPSYTIKLSSGNSGNYTNRTLTSLNDNLYYNLFLDPARNIIFGDGNSGTSFYSGSGEQIVIYGVIKELQRVTPGTYGDSINIELSF